MLKLVTAAVAAAVADLAKWWMKRVASIQSRIQSTIKVVKLKVCSKFVIFRAVVGIGVENG